MQPFASGTGHLDNEQFVAAFEKCELPNSDFRHFDHIRLGWIYLTSTPLDSATDRMVTAIRNFAVHNHGDTGMFHATITRVWMRLISARMQTSGQSFAEFVAANPELFNKSLMFEYYSEPLLMSAAARTEWVEPDLKPLP